VGGTRLNYVPGSRDPIDGAVDTPLAGNGVCRDYAHLVVALLRAVNVPARLVAVYAPGLSPMNSHAVAEAFVDGAWRVVDATCLAPRQTLVRIATGRDAADTAFLDNHKGAINLNNMTVTATSESYCQDLWMRLFQATSVSDDLSGSVGVMSTGRSRSFPLWKTAPARTRATRCGALTARQRV
jgi:hypothetical protein